MWGSMVRRVNGANGVLRMQRGLLIDPVTTVVRYVWQQTEILKRSAEHSIYRKGKAKGSNMNNASQVNVLMVKDEFLEP